MAAGDGHTTVGSEYGAITHPVVDPDEYFGGLEQLER